ncbi:DUF2971 domain-containing protein [Aliarcobacter butzleri]|uniref:DUF2971 domain-containing protein n=1 Tax=Aliarcobacter butzleri TaxID=28197 RepID=UPI00125ECB00|nr:DUF2971 domain-containing protein [Aliarcobacter butzleri]MCT7560639.1 DUF2971 domain-containing protein [Aliarcobacter butzleri]MCT7627137.1 DUF2971 domain-containing protein [Aliarcobacter butzleri]UWY61077.1 DUF2971 domain-containing protein [Aliarcobacter butzleri]
MLVYKYRSGLDRDIEALINNQSYAADIESLNDIQEGKIIINNQEIEIFDLFIANNLSNFDTSINNILKEFREDCKKFGIYSLSKDYKNELLWAYYGNSNKGFCIEYDFEILKQFPFNEDSFYDVEYSENIPVVNLQDIVNFSSKSNLPTKLLATKSLSWEREEEIRIITSLKGKFNYLSRAVKSIYFGNRTDENTIYSIMEKLKGRKIKYYKMTHKKNLYELERVEIDDIFKNESIYKNKVNKFIPSIDEKTKTYEDLIKKAIIIVEQDSLCGEVIDAYISSNKGTKNNPVFFITYKNENRNISTRNCFISKKEIEEIFNKDS